MKIKILVALSIFALCSSVYGQKGIFKNGNILQKQYTDTLSFEIVRDAIIVDVIVKGKAYKFFLDTGAPTVFGHKIAGDFDIITEEEITDASNTEETVKYINVPSLIIGNISYENISAMRYDIGVLEEFGADGILGANIMAKSVWDFNWETKQIIVSNVRNKKITNTVKPVKVKLLETGSPIITINHFDTLEEEIYIDFGFNGLFSLAHNTYLFLKENDLIKKSISGRGNYLQTAFAATDSIFSQVVLQSKIDHFQLPDFIADVDYDEESSIGSEFLKYYRIVINFPKKKMYFVPNGKKIKAEFESYGINWRIKGNDMLVSFIWLSSKAFADGIRVSDKILSINGINTKNVDELTPEDTDKINELFEGIEKIVLEINQKGNFIEIEKELLLE